MPKNTKRQKEFNLVLSIEECIGSSVRIVDEAELDNFKTEREAREGLAEILDHLGYEAEEEDDENSD